MELSRLNSVWDEVLKRLQTNIADNNVFDAFFQDTKLYSVEGDNAYISVSSKFAKELLGTRYLKDITDTLEEVSKEKYNCIITIKNEAVLEEPELPKNNEVVDSFDSQLNANYTFENFVVGASNQEAHSASLMAALEPGKLYNPLFIYGRSGVGKTHLLHAIGNYIRLKGNEGTKVYYISSVEYLDNYVNSLIKGRVEIETFKNNFKTVDVLLVDDIQFLSDKQGSTETFFHIFNNLFERKKQIVITSDRPPAELKGFQERLISRFSSGLSVNIRNPEYETAVRILKKKIELLEYTNKTIKEDVLNYVALKYSKDIRQLEGALNRLIFYADTFKKQSKVIDLEIAQEALKGLVVNNKVIDSNTLTIDKIKMVVGDYYKISVSQLNSSSRISTVALARHISMFLIRTLLDVPFAKIGEEFGNRDHSTVINACTKVEKMLKKDPNFKQAIDDIQLLLK